ncbi:iron complex outermembrane recepter protein [Halopseudomonas sabulinigri]|uniref:Iron complex outermembrane recepter protein n=1 Tax=Halopseudomonas sabulinigri TaxID=472181 RepID=A0A1H1U858_9GAMM|nr:TonB-dependent siderophore receptor [Halopseudomonas sabulinigri]SDS68678.1 iron complex outermembrane recepter protein [Halopseudomonas sabulinigri]
MSPSLVFKRTALSLALSSVFVSALTQAQEVDEQTTDAVELPSMTVSASADASADGLPPAYAGGQVAAGSRVGILGNQDYMETPFTTTSYTQTLIQDQQAASIGDVLLNDPAVRVARGFGNFQQVYMVRGLPIFSDDISYNGLYGLLPRQYMGTEFVERVEVLRGANAFLNGAAPGGSGLGGAINIVPKRAPNEDLNEVTAGVRSGGQYYTAGDFGRRFADDRIGVRLNMARRDGDVAVDGESGELGLLALGADYRGDNLRISADLGYQNHEVDAGQPNITIGAGVPVPSAPDADKSVAQSWTYSNAEDTFGTLRAEYDFNDYVTGWLAGGVRTSEEEGNFANPTVINTAGDTNAYRFYNVREDEVVTGDMGLRFRFDTGPVSHQLTTSASTYEMKSANAWGASSFATREVLGNINNPFDSAQPAATAAGAGSLSDPEVTERTRTSSYAIADTLGFMDDRLLVTLGARQQNIATYSYAYADGSRTASYDDDAITPIAGVVYRVTPEVSAYANYIEGLVKGDVAPTTSGGAPVTNGGEALEPYVTRQAELGVKYDGGRLGGSLGVFQSRRPVAGVDASNTYGVVGKQRYRGLEFSAFGQATNDLTVLGGVSLLDTELNGNEGIGAPELQASVGLDYLVPGVDGLAFDGRMIYTSEQYIDAANTRDIPSWTRFDLGARYSMLINDAQELTLRARVENVANRDYWASAGGYPGSGYLTVGAPRTLVVSTTLDF